MGSSDVKTLEIVELGTLNMYFKPSLFSPVPVITGCSLTSDIAEGIGSYKLDAKDIINVRSEISTFRPSNKPHTHDYAKRAYTLDDVNDFYTYLVTILIELDPL